MSKNCIITTVKGKIKGNATSYIEKENEIFIPVSKKFTLKQTRVIAQDKVNKINKEYLSEKFGAVVSLNTSYTDGTGIKIHPSQLLIDAYEVKEGNKSIEELNPRNLDYFNGDEALLEQEQREFNFDEKEFNFDRIKLVSYFIDKGYQNINENNFTRIFNDYQKFLFENPQFDIDDFIKLIENNEYSIQSDLNSFIDESKKIADEIKDVEQQVQEEKTIKPGVAELFESKRSFADYSDFGKTLSEQEIINLKEEGNKVTAKQFLESITPVNDFEKKLKSFLLSIDLNKLNNFDFVINNKYQGNIIGLNERELFEKPTVIFNSKATNQPSRYKLHEFLHSLLDTVINQEQEFRTELISLYDYVKTLPEFKNEYGVIGWWEFYTEGMTNPYFQAKLKNVTLSGYKGGKKSSVYKEFIKIINSLLEKLGFVNKDYSALDEIINVTTKVIEKRYGYGIKPGVQELFESNSEFAAIGTQEQYSQYLDTIFPDSKVKDIVYHGTNKNFDTFSKDFSKTGIGENVYNSLASFSSDIRKTTSYGNNIISVLLNIKNPEIDSYRESEIPSSKALGKKDSIISYPNTNYKETDYFVFEPEQIHILGSKQDIEGFKEFVQEERENKYYQVNDETIKKIEEPKSIDDLFNTLSSIENSVNLITNSVLNNELVSNYYLTQTNENRFKTVLEKEGISINQIDYITDFIKNNNLFNRKLSEIIGIINQEIILNSNGLNYYNAILKDMANEKLDGFLKDFLSSQLNVSVIDNMVNHYGSPMAVADILNKVIQINKKNLKTLPEETGHFFFELLGNQNALQKQLIDGVESWEGYQNVFDKYKTIYLKTNIKNEIVPDINKIKREAVGQAIGEGLIRNFKAREGDSFFSSLQKAIDYIKKLFADLDIFNFNSVVDDIAKDILNNDISKIKQIKDEHYKKRTYKETLANNPEILEIIENIQKLGGTLTGSLAYRDQGDLYRPDDELVHDLDFRIYYDVYNGDIQNFIEKITKIYPVIEYRRKSNGEIMTWTDSNGHTSFLLRKGEILIDLFFYPKQIKNENNKFSNWYGAFVEKYKMGRPKDMNDILRWSNFKQQNLFDKDQPFVYYQLEEKEDLKPFIDESNKVGDESINERLKKYEESIKIPNSVRSKVLEKIEKETEKVKEKLLSLGLKQEGNKFELITNSYATFRMKLKELENVNVIISTNKTSDFYQIIARLKNVDSTMELKKQGELPFTPIEVKQIIQEQQFLNDVADNVFEELSEEEKQILKKKIENGDYNLNCKI